MIVAPVALPRWADHAGYWWSAARQIYAATVPGRRRLA